MEESLRYFKEQFHLPDIDLRTYSPLTLAYIGDGVYEALIRTYLVGKGNAPVGRLHKRSSALVSAKAQAVIVKALLPHLTEEEAQVYKRGRNAHPSTVAKNATVADYRRATGFEALVGYLYLKEDWKRLTELVKIGLKSKGETI